MAAERLVFAPRMMPPEHLARTRLADLFLDTLPYNAHTTASDALWMGLPVVTCPGNTFPSRVAASLLHAIGMPELVTSSLAEYEALARNLAARARTACGDQGEAHAQSRYRAHVRHGAFHALSRIRLHGHVGAATGGSSAREFRYSRRSLLAMGDDSTDAPETLAKLHFQAGRFEEALRFLDLAIAADSGRAQLWNNRGAVLATMKRFAAAYESFDRALALEPGFAGALANRAHVLMELHRPEEAIGDYERLLAHNSEIPFARGNLIRAKLECCDWRGLQEEWERALSDMRAGKPVIPPMVSTALCQSPGDQLVASRILTDAKYPPAQVPLWKGERYRHERIRIAYLSSDFHAHATATLMAGVFEAHDRSRFETIAVSFGPDDGSAMRRRLTGAFEHFLAVAEKSDADIASLLREKEVDIAIDLKGFTDQSRPAILSARPAPLQVNYLGFPATMGAPYMDYIIADRMVIPPEHHIHYSEKVVYLPHTYQPNDRTRRVAENTPTRAEAGLPQTGFVFCCFNSSYKIGPEMFDIWMRLLGDVEDSVLWLLEDSPAAMRNLKREAAARGMAAERLVFAPRRPVDEHLARHVLADLFLDTLPYNAHTTASDALWMGLPLVTCPGDTFPSRVAASLLSAIGMPELVTSSLGEYEDLALELAREPERLAAIKAKLARNRDTSPLFDAARFTRHLESAYTIMWERQQRGQAPASFAVEPSEGQGFYFGSGPWLMRTRSSGRTHFLNAA